MTKKKASSDGPDATEPESGVDQPPIEAPAEAPADAAETAPPAPPDAPPVNAVPSGRTVDAPVVPTPEIGVQPVTHAATVLAQPADRPADATPATHVVLTDKRGVSRFYLRSDLEKNQGGLPRMVTLPAPAVDSDPSARLAGRPALAPQGDLSFERSGTDVDGFVVYTQPEF